MAVAPAGDGEERKPTDAEASLSGEGTPLPEAAQRPGTDKAALMAAGKLGDISLGELAIMRLRDPSEQVRAPG